MVAIGLCTAFSGLTGLGLSLALCEGGGSGSGLLLLALGVAGLAGAVYLPFRMPDGVIAAPLTREASLFQGSPFV